MRRGRRSRTFLRRIPPTVFGGPVSLSRRQEPSSTISIHHPLFWFPSTARDRQLLDRRALDSSAAEELTGRAGLADPLNKDLGRTGPAAGALLVERQFELRPGESRNLHFLYGYIPEGFDLDSLVREMTTNSVSRVFGSAPGAPDGRTKGIRLTYPFGAMGGTRDFMGQLLPS